MTEIKRYLLPKHQMALLEWGNFTTASIDAQGRAWVEGAGPGHFLSDREVNRFFEWLEAY
jgi:hypothetical protein